MNSQITTPAEIIAKQLGGIRRVALMLSARDFISSNEGRTLTFKFRGCKKADCVRITLNGRDLYDLEFIKLGKLNRKTFEFAPHKTAKSLENIYADQLVELIEDFTGLYLSI